MFENTDGERARCDGVQVFGDVGEVGDDGRDVDDRKDRRFVDSEEEREWDSLDDDSAA